MKYASEAKTNNSIPNLNTNVHRNLDTYIWTKHQILFA